MKLTAATTTQTAARSAPVLLLADDGRMGDVLTEALPEVAVVREVDLMSAVLRLSNMDCRLVLLNAEVSAARTGEIVRAIAKVQPQADVVLYGAPYAEIWSRSALQDGARDFLPWPIPAGEIRTIWRRITARETGRFCDDAETAAASGSQSVNALVAAYRQLAFMAPQGVAALIKEAERRLPDVLRVRWAQVDHNAAAGETPQRPTRPECLVVPMTGPQGDAGFLRLGPPTTDMPERVALAQQAGQLIAALLHLAEREAGLRQLAVTDPLTGAYNRRYLEHFVGQLIAQRDTHPPRMTLLLFDIDEFKHYNDTYGHGAGDEILREVYLLMRRCCRSHDVVARLGGDEFVVLFWDAPEAVVANEDKNNHNERRHHGQARWSHADMVKFMSNRFRRVVRTNKFRMLGQESRGAVTISGGLASYPDGNATLEDLLAAADKALLDAKRKGKNRIAFSSD